MVSWNRTGIKKALKLGILIGRVEKLLKGNIREFWAGDKAIDQNSNVVVTRSNGVKCRNTPSNLELFSLSDLLGPVLEISVLLSKSIGILWSLLILQGSQLGLQFFVLNKIKSSYFTSNTQQNLKNTSCCILVRELTAFCNIAASISTVAFLD